MDAGPDAGQEAVPVSDAFPYLDFPWAPTAPAAPPAESGCPTCKVAKVCTKDGDKAVVQGDGSYVSSYDPTAPHQDTLEEINKRIDDAMAPWEIFNGIFGGFDPSMRESDMNFGD